MYNHPDRMLPRFSCQRLPAGIVTPQTRQNQHELGIQASDGEVVTGVQVMVLDEEGKIVEKGDATQGRGDWWEYIPGAAGKVVVEARDLRGIKRGQRFVSRARPLLQTDYSATLMQSLQPIAKS